MPDLASRSEPTIIGGELPRVDGPVKVSGLAAYAADHVFPDMLYAVPVGAAIAHGTATKIDSSQARQMPGVRAVFTRENLGPFKEITPDFAKNAFVDEKRAPFADDEIRYWGQYVALVVADSLEEAQAGAEAVRVSYRAKKPDVRAALTAKKTRTASERGQPEEAFARAPVKIDATYAIAPETHNPIETHATVAKWDGNRLTLYETSQGVVNHRNVLADLLGVPRDNVRVISKFIGSGFGGKLWPWAQSPLTAEAARKLGRPVKCVLSRRAMFHAVGHRPRIEQRMRLGAQTDGKLVAILHDYVNATSMLDDYEENCGEATPHLYSAPNLRVTSGLAHRTIGTPTSMRGPGAVPGLYATESAMDELAVELGIDPVALRLMNEPQIDESSGLPFSSRHLKECLTLGAEKFGWSGRDPRIGSMKRAGATIGWGVASCSWIAARFDCSVSVELRADGTVRLACAAQDIGTGTYTVAAQMAAQALDVDLDRVEVILGDTDAPPGPLSGGSMMTASLVAPIEEAIKAAGRALVDAVAARGGVAPASFQGGRLVREGQNSRMRFDEVLRELGTHSVVGHGSAKGTFASKAKRAFSSHSFGAHFVEATWRPEIGRIGVSRVVTIIDAGRILNPLLARNQIQGAVVMGVGMALLEGSEYDPANGAPVNSSLADYLVATHADVPALETHFIEYPDYNLNPLGARGVGEIGLAGVAAAIMSAVAHATGVRIRNLPMRIEDVL